jgi:transcriptional regulator with XRE-family HTH domain
VSTPLGDFVRARRDATQPGSVGLPAGGRRRAPGLRRSELAVLAGISVEYLVRIEQGRDHHPSVSVVNALADALRLDPTEREHLRYLAKLGSASCLAALAQPRLEVRPKVRTLLEAFEPGIALLTNQLGDVLAYTSGFDQLARPTGLLDPPSPNLTRFVFTDHRARNVFPDWERIAEERAFDLQLAPPGERSERLVADLEVVAGRELTKRLDRHQLPDRGTQRWHHPVVGEVRLEREVLELPAADAQQLVVFLPADDTTADALTRLRRAAATRLRVVN